MNEKILPDDIESKSLSELTDIADKLIQELENKIVDLKKELMDSRFALATSQIEDTSVFKKIKKG